MKFPQYDLILPYCACKETQEAQGIPENIARQTCPRRDRQDKEEIEAETQRVGQLL